MQRHPHSGKRRVVLPTRRSFVDRPPRSQQASAGYSLIELIVAIAIVAILLAILLPAIQAVRESSRRTACNNHLRQMSLGILQHESKTGYLITGGWSPLWLGVAERSADGRQPGGWTYNVLPYVEELALHESVEGVTADTAEAAYQALAVANVPLFNCPSRRHVRPLPIDMKALESSTSGTVAFNTTSSRRSPFMFASMKKGNGNGNGGGNGNGAGTSGPAYFRTAVDLQVTLPLATRTDYAANGGSYGVCLPMESVRKYIDAASLPSHKVLVGHATGSAKNPCVEVPVSWSAMNGNGHGNHPGDVIGGCPDQPSCTNPIDNSVYTPATVADGDAWRKATRTQRMSLPDAGIPDLQDGIITRMGRIASASVLDGLGNVYLLGEKYVAADHYETGNDPGDAGVLYSGYSSSNIRWAGELPRPDTAGEFHNNAYGSAHAGGFNMAFGDGRIETLSFDIDPAVHRALAGRANGTMAVVD
jgi:prepilin-type N-terminal cleavage/methylation domain-containing protein/prepilin-type processing-associated H-X9-DG protein